MGHPMAKTFEDKRVLEVYLKIDFTGGIKGWESVLDMECVRKMCFDLLT